MATAINWRDLHVTDGEGDYCGTLGDLVDSGHRGLNQIDEIGPQGEIVEWTQYFMTAPGEDPDWDTPRGPVDWTGLREALAALAAADGGFERLGRIAAR